MLYSITAPYLRFRSLRSARHDGAEAGLDREVRRAPVAAVGIKMLLLLLVVVVVVVVAVHATPEYGSPQ